MNLFDFGQSLYHQGEFLRAAEVLEEYCAHADKNSETYREAVFRRLRIYTELEDTYKRVELEKEVSERLKNLDARGASAFYYVQGYNAHVERKYMQSHQLFEQSLLHALESQCRYTLAQALFGCIFSALKLDKPMESISSKMETLELLASQLGRADLEVSVLSLKANISIQNREYKRAIELTWQSFEKVKLVKNNFLSLSAIAKVGYIYLEIGDHEKARIYIQLAKRSMDPKNYKLLAKYVAGLERKLSQEPLSDFDLVLNEGEHTLIEKQKGTIELKNQFLLMDLLKLLMENPGVPFSKESLAEKLWKQKYDPHLHDNTIYVTIKRIRSLIEPNPHHSKYILRSRQGYLLNQDSKIFIQTKEANT